MDGHAINHFCVPTLRMTKKKVGQGDGYTPPVTVANAQNPIVLTEDGKAVLMENGQAILIE